MSARRALIAEDNAALSRVIAFSLRKAGFATTVAADGAEALRHAELAEYDLVVTDHQMPHLTGVQLTARLREMDRFRDTPIVLLTAKGLELDADRLAADYGVAAVLIKPFSPTDLGKLVGELTSQPV